MNHGNKNKKFGRKKGQRNAFIKTLISNLIQKGGISTTEARAKMLKKEAEKLVTLAKKQQTASLRLLVSRLPKKSAQKLFYEIAPRYTDRKGGYLRLTKLGKQRLGDRAKMIRIEFI